MLSMTLSRLYLYFLSCWVMGAITDAQLNTAVSKGYVTSAEKEQIIATLQN